MNDKHKTLYNKYQEKYRQLGIDDGTIVIRNGMITNVGSKIKIPNQATILDMDGKHIYAGFIESWLE